MFRRMIMAIKGVLAKMGLINGVRRLEGFGDIAVNPLMFDSIEIWRFLYKGYYDLWHNVRYHTIDGYKWRKMDTINMSKIASNEMAGLVFDEECTISASTQSISDFLDGVLKDNDFYKLFQTHLEYMFALGGLVMMPYVDNGEICITFVNADCFIPTSWRGGMVSEGIFIDETRKDKYIYTHLSWHKQAKNDQGQSGYIITNRLFRKEAGSDTNTDIIGIEVPLDLLYDDLEPIVNVFPLDKPLFTYIKPNIANNIDLQTPLGISLIHGALHTMHAIDTAFDSFHREFRLGKKRIMIPQSMIRVTYDKEGKPHRYFDANDETYQGMDVDGDAGGNDVKDINVVLRVEEHVGAIKALLDLFAMQTGFSAGTFTFDGQSVKTATEVISKDSKTFKSKKSHETIIESGLCHLMDSILALAKNEQLFTAPDDYEITIQFDDSIIEDRQAELADLIQEVNNKLKPRKRAIMDFYGLTESEADQWMQEIAEENATAVAEQMDMFGMGGQNASLDDEDDA